MPLLHTPFVRLHLIYHICINNRNIYIKKSLKKAYSDIKNLTSNGQFGNAASTSLDLLSSSLDKFPVRAGLAVGTTLLLKASLDKLADTYNLTYDAAYKNTSISLDNYKNQKAEVDSLNTQLQTTHERMDKLNNIKNPTLTDHAELTNLQKRSDEAERNLAIKQKMAQFTQKEAADNAKDTLNSGKKSVAQEAAVKYDGAPAVYQQDYEMRDVAGAIIENVSEIERYENKIKDLEKQKLSFEVDSSEWKKADKEIQKCNNAINMLNNDLDDKVPQLETILEAITLDGEGLIALDGYENEFNRVQSALDALTGDAGSYEKKLKIDAIFENDEFQKAQQELVDAMRLGEDISVDDLTNQFPGLVAACDEAGIKAKDLLANLQAIAAQEGGMTALERDFLSTISTIEGAIDNVETMKNILSESTSGSGISPESVKMFHSMYGPDAEKALEKTAGGYRLNKEALSELESQHKSLNEVDILSQLSSQYDQLRDTQEDIAKANLLGQDTTILETKQNGINAHIDELKELQYQYETTSSAYSKWQAALAGGEDGDMYDSIQGNLQSIEDMFNRGLYGTEAFKTSMNLLSYSDTSDDSTEDLIERYHRQMDTVKKYMTDDSQGVNTFLSDFATQGDSEFEWSLNSNIDEIAEQLDVDVEFIETILSKASDFGHNVDFEYPLESLGEMRTTAEEAIQSLTDLEANALAGVNLDADSLPAITDEIKAVQEYIKALEENPSEEHSAEKLEHAKEILDYLVAQQEILSQTEGFSFDLNPEEMLESLNVATEAVNAFYEKVQGDGAESFQFNFEAGADEIDGEIARAVEMMELFKDRDGNLDLSIEGADSALYILQSLVAQKSEVSQPVIMDVDSSQVAGDLGGAISQLQQFHTAVQELNNAQTLKSAGVDIDVSAAEAKVSSLAQSIQGIDPTILASLNIDTGSAQTISSSLAALSPEIMVKAGVDTSALSAQTVPPQSGTVKYDADFSTAISKKPPEKSGVVNYTATFKTLSPPVLTQFIRVVKSPLFTGTAQAAGTAHSYGHAFASGNWSVPRNELSLVGELGQETVVRGGHYFTVGDTGAEFVNLRRGDIVFNHLQTRDLMSKGYVNSRASVYGMAYAGGTVGNISTISSANSKATTVSTASNKTGDALKELTDYFDWLKIRLESVAKETKRAMDAIDNAVGIANKQSQTALALSKTQSEMTAARQAYDKYMAQANSFASKAGLSAGLQKQVQTGAVDISKYDDDTKTKIKEYQDWYNKAQSCLDTIEDLKKQEQKLALQRLENIDKYYNAVIAVNKSMQDTNKARMSLSKDLGSNILSSEITDSLQSSIKKQQESYDKTAQQLAEYQKEFNNLVAKGYIARDSDAWYDGQKQLEKFTEEMYKSQSALIDFQDQLRELDYTALEQTIDRISDALDRLQNGEKLKDKRDEQMTEAEYLQQLDEVNKSIDTNYKLRNAKLEEQALYDVGSERYNSLAKEIAKIDSSIYSSLNEIESIKDKIVEVRLFDFKQEREDAKDLISELDTFRKFLNDDAFVDKNGVLTGDGLANIALIGQAMAIAKQEIAEYTEGISKLDELLQNGMIGTAEYEKQQSEFLKAIKDSALNVEGYKETLISLYKTQLKTENSALSESIKLRKQALKSMENYYSYANKVNTQTKDVNAIKAQIAALQGVNNTSAQAELKRLQAQLHDAEDSLSDTKRQHQNDMIEQGYNEMSDGLDKALEDTLDELTYNADKQEEVVANMLNNVVGMYGTAYDAIRNIIAGTGLVGSNDFNNSVSNIGSAGGAADIVNSAAKSQHQVSSSNTSNAINTGGINIDHSAIEDDLAKAPNTDNRLCAELKLTQASVSMEEGGSKSVTAAIRPTDAKNKTLSWTSSDPSVATAINGQIKGIKAGTARITASTTDGSGLSASCTATVTARPKPPTPDTTTSKSTQGDGVPNVGDKVTFTSGLYYEDSYGKGRKGSYYLGKQVYITKVNAKGSKPYHISTGTTLGKGDLGWLTLSQIKGYAAGTSHASDGLALFDDTAGQRLDLGSEVIMTSHGVLRQMNAGDMVFNKDQTKRLWEMSQNLAGPNIGASKVAAYNVERQSNRQVNIHFDSMLNVEGNATPDTLTLADSMIPELAGKLGRYVTKELKKI